MNKPDWSDLFKIILDPIDFRLWTFYGSIISVIALRYIFIKQLLPTVFTHNNIIFMILLIFFAGLTGSWARERSLSMGVIKYMAFAIAITIKIFVLLYLLVKLSIASPTLFGYTFFKINSTTVMGILETAVISSVVYTIRWFAMQRRILQGGVSERI